ncbi:MAG: 4Fe-4S double cluster binding domain-containing protein [Aristaeellaceae bacterium]
MDVAAALKEAGFHRVIPVDARLCEGLDHGTLLLALWFYEAEREPDMTHAWIHPYYFASQKAYLAAAGVVKAAQVQGMGITLRDDVRVKPIFARLPGFTQGRNTLSYVEGAGSRFHVQILLVDDAWPDVTPLEPEIHALHCGHCRACMDACPNHAIDEEGFHRERCIRNWMMSGKPIPEDVRHAMGNRLIGCDACQRCCPHNPPPMGDCMPGIPLDRLLREPKAAVETLRPLIGVNLTIPNRVLSQACVMAGSEGDASFLPVVESWTEHPSPTVREHAAWACQAIRSRSNTPESMD